MDRFIGDQIHSHDYRAPERFKDTNVLIIGSGPSGFDICGDVAKVANQVRVWSYTHIPRTVFIRIYLSYLPPMIVLGRAGAFAGI